MCASRVEGHLQCEQCANLYKWMAELVLGETTKLSAAKDRKFYSHDRQSRVQGTRYIMFWVCLLFFLGGGCFRLFIYLFLYFMKYYLFSEIIQIVHPSYSEERLTPEHVFLFVISCWDLLFDDIFFTLK